MYIVSSDVLDWTYCTYYSAYTTNSRQAKSIPQSTKATPTQQHGQPQKHVLDSLKTPRGGRVGDRSSTQHPSLTAALTWGHCEDSVSIE